MSWLSKKVDQARNATDDLGAKMGLSPGARKYFRIGVASMGGGMGLQYEYSRNKGMNSNEATKNAIGGGITYQQSRAEQKERIAADEAEVTAQAVERTRIAEEARAKGQIAVRVRRGMRDRGTTRSGTMATGPGGLGSNGFGAFAALLGL